MIVDLEPFLVQWRWLPSHVGKYAVHESGAIWNVRTARILRPSRGKNGYPTVPVDTRGRYVHDLVLEAWHGPRPEPHLVARHLNDIPEDNRADNLAWGTRLQNAEDAKRNGRPSGARGVRHPRAKLDEGKVRQIRAYRTYGFTVREIAGWFGVSEPTVSHVVGRRNWGHVA